MGHLADKRVRGSRLVRCSQVIEAGLVDTIADDEVEASRQLARAQHRAAYKRGHTQVLSDKLTKRRLGSAVPPLRVDDDNLLHPIVNDVPANMACWDAVVSMRALRRKTRLDEILASSHFVIDRGAVAKKRRVVTTGVET